MARLITEYFHREDWNVLLGMPYTSEFNIIPSTPNNEFVYLVGLEEVVQFSLELLDNDMHPAPTKRTANFPHTVFGKRQTKGKKTCLSLVAVPATKVPLTCAQCKTDFTCSWRQDKSGAIVCEYCATLNQKKARKKAKKKALKKAMKKATKAKPTNPMTAASVKVSFKKQKVAEKLILQQAGSPVSHTLSSSSSSSSSRPEKANSPAREPQKMHTMKSNQQVLMCRKAYADQWHLQKAASRASHAHSSSSSLPSASSPSSSSYPVKSNQQVLMCKKAYADQWDLQKAASRASHTHCHSSSSSSHDQQVLESQKWKAKQQIQVAAPSAFHSLSSLSASSLPLEADQPALVSQRLKADEQPFQYQKVKSAWKSTEV